MSNQKEIFKKGFETLVKAEYIENLAYAYGYTEKIFVPVEGEIVEVEVSNEAWILEKKQEQKTIMNLVDNPVSKLDFVVTKVFEFMNEFLSEKIKEGWAIKLELELEKAKEKLKDLF